MLNKNNTFYSSLLSGSGMLIVLLILLLFNVIAYHTNLRWDVTEDGLYSLSPNSLKIISEIKDEVVFKVFYSKSIPNVPAYIKTYSQRVIDFLSEYQYRSNGKIKVEVYDPKMDSDEEEWADLYGIEGIQLPTGETLYFGMVANAADQEQKIAFFDPLREEHLEYDITEILYKLQRPNKPKVGIISNLPIFGNPPAYGASPQDNQPWLFVTELKKTYEITKIDPKSHPMANDLDLLIIINPKKLNASLVYDIDQFLLAGGRLFIFADPLALTDSSQGTASSTGLEPLFKKWGITVDTKRALVDFDYTTERPTDNNQTEENPFWLSIPQSAFNPKPVITSQLESMLLLVAGHIEPNAQFEHEFEPLLQSSNNAALVDAYKGRQGYVDQIRKEFKPTQKVYTIAAKINGVFKTAFPHGKPKTVAEKDLGSTPSVNTNETPQLKKGLKKSTIVIVADADLLFDGVYVQKLNFLGQTITQMFNDNLNFVLNTTEFLTGSQELIDIRSRGKFKRPFDRVVVLEKKAEKKWLAKEQELTKKAEEANQKLTELENKKDKSQRVLVSKEQEEQIRRFQAEKQDINKELKIVRRNLNADIKKLGLIIKCINILLMPLLVTIAGIAFAYFRQRRMSHSIKMK